MKTTEIRERIVTHVLKQKKRQILNNTTENTVKGFLKHLFFCKKAYVFQQNPYVRTLKDENDKLIYKKIKKLLCRRSIKKVYNVF
jgi:hypothetical protein